MIILRDKTYLEQREYGLGSDIWHSGIKRTAQKYIGRGRTKAARYISRSIESDARKMQDAIGRADTLGRAAVRDNNPILVERLKDQAVKEGAIVKSGYGYTAGMTSARSLPEGSVPPGVSGIITLPQNSYPAMVSHEVGHLLNTKGGPLAKRVSLADERVRTAYKDASDLIGSTGSNRRQGIGKTFKDYIKGRVILSEEARASKRGRNLMRKVGATPQEIKQAEAIHKAELDTYRTEANAGWKSTLRNTVQIPSRVRRADGSWVHAKIDTLPTSQRVAYNRNPEMPIWW